MKTPLQVVFSLLSAASIQAIFTAGIEPTAWSDPPHSFTRRELLQSCEYNVDYDITGVTESNFTAQFTIVGNREIESRLQLVYKYVAKERILPLANILGQEGVRLSAVNGARVRISNATAPIPGTNSTFSTIASFNSSPADGSESLLIDALNVNGMQCSQTWPTPPDKLPQNRCYNTISFFSAFAAENSKRGRNDACKASFCCGYVLQQEVNVWGVDVSHAAEVTVPPTATSARLEESGGGNNRSQSRRSNEQQLQANGKITNNSSTENSDDSVGPLMGAVIAMVILLVIAIAAISYWLIKVYRRHRQDAPSPDTTPNNFLPKLHSNKSNLTQGFGSMEMFDGVLDSEEGSLSPGGSLSSKSERLFHTQTLAQAVSLRHTLNPTSNNNALVTIGGGISSTVVAAAPGIIPSRTGSADVASLTESGSKQSSNDPVAENVILYEELGSGAFGVVYRGSWNNQPVAVKVLQTSCSQSSKELNSFKKEIEVLSQLRHPNIISFYAACTVWPDVCIIEELAVGGSLYTKLHGKPGENRRLPLPYPELINIASDIADAMHYLHCIHQPKIVHRDLKSQNVLCDAEGRAKVCDFGIAKFKDKTFMSTVNGQAGTAQYMAPEIFDNAQVTEKVDVFAFGVLLWEMLTGLVPWANVTPMQVIYYVAVLQSRPPLPKTCPQGLKELIEQCWDESPAKRPAFDKIKMTLQQLVKNAVAMQDEDGHHLDVPRAQDAQLRLASKQGNGGENDEFKAFALHQLTDSPPSMGNSEAGSL